MAFTHTNAGVAALERQVSGSVILPGDEGYERARRGWNLTIDQRPALIVAAESTADVAAAVKFAHEHGLGVGVQNSGHGVQYPADDNLLINIGGLHEVEIDAEARTARAGGGARWGHVLEKALPFGLAPLLGTTPHVGVVGYTLGGGIGWLAREYGLAADSVEWIEVVTAEGSVRRAGPDENADLFWAMRGGGGNFGVVTALGFRLYPVARLYGGMLTYPGEIAGEALTFYRDWVATAPERLTSSIALMHFPNAPQLPPAMRGKRVVWVRAAFDGSAEAGAALIEPWLKWRAPVANTMRDMPFGEIATIANDPTDPASTYTNNEQLNELSDGAIAAISAELNRDDSPLFVTEIRHAGGAIGRGGEHAAAVANRDAQFYLTMGGFGPNEQARAGVTQAIRAYQGTLKPYLRGSAYLNFTSGGLARDRVRDTFSPATYERLLAVKERYDPANTFRYSYQLV